MRKLELTETELFSGVSEEEIVQMNACMGFTVKKYRKKETIFSAGARITGVGIVLSGSVRLEHNERDGSAGMLTMVQTGGVFGEAYAAAVNEVLTADVVANEDCEVLLIPAEALLKPCGNPCGCHMKVLRNLLAVSARKNIALSRRMADITPKTIRERVLSYLTREAAVTNCSEIRVPFNRQQMADYLSVDRSALSKELGLMQRDGLLQFSRDRFTLLQFDK